MMMLLPHADDTIIIDVITAVVAMAIGNIQFSPLLFSLFHVYYVAVV